MGGLKDVIESKAGILAKIVGTSAPILASILGSPLAGVGISLLAGAFGADPSNIDDVMAKIQADPDAQLKLKMLEDQHAENLAKIGQADFQLQVADVQQARGNIPIYKDFLRHMAILVTIGFFGAITLLCVPIQFDNNERELLSMLIGMLVSKWQTIIDFFYGSSDRERSIYNGRN